VVAAVDENPPNPVENGDDVVEAPRGDAVAVVAAELPNKPPPVGLNWF